MTDFSPLPWGEGGESSEPGEGFLPTEPRNFGIRVQWRWTIRQGKCRVRGGAETNGLTARVHLLARK